MSFSASVGVWARTQTSSAGLFPEPLCPPLTRPSTLYPNPPLINKTKQKTQNTHAQKTGVKVSSCLVPFDLQGSPGKARANRGRGRAWVGLGIGFGTPLGSLSCHCQTVRTCLSWQMFYTQSPPQDKYGQQTHRWTYSHCLQGSTNDDNLKYPACVVLR